MNKIIPHKKIFVQDCSIFKNDILVVVGLSCDDILRYSRKIAKKYIIDVLEENKNEITKLINNSHLGFYYYEDLNGASILWLRKYNKNDWQDLECLMHELYHAVDFISDQKGFEKEIEAKAFLFEWLFRQIRIKLL